MKNKSNMTIHHLCVILFTLSTGMLIAQEQFDLQQAIAYGMEHSRNLKIQQLEIGSANADIKDFRSIGMPKINGNIGYQYYFDVPAQPIPDFITPSVYEVLFEEEVLERRDLGPPEISEISFFQPHNLNAGLEASMLVFDGSYLVGLKAAKLYKELVAKQLNATEQEIKANITKAYMAVLIARENLKVVENNLKTVKTSLEETKILYQEGFAESLDVDRLTLSFNQLTTEMDKLNGLIQISENLLKFQMGMEISASIELTEKLENIVGTFNMELVDLAEPFDYRKRAEFEVLQTNKELNELDMKRYKAGYLPSVSIFGNIQRSLQRNDLFDGNESGWIPQSAAGVGISIPIYDGGEKSALIQKAKLNIEKADLQLQEFMQSMNLQVYNAKLAMINAKKSVENTGKALAINEEIYRKAQIKFREGVGSSVEVTQAEASLYNAQGAYINALYDLVTAKTDLDIALGEI